MKLTTRRYFFSMMASLAMLLLLQSNAFAQDQLERRGFVKLFDGTSLNGWKIVGQHGAGYVPKDGVLVCPADGGGNLYTEKEYTDFIFRFDFKLAENGNNGVGLRAPMGGDAAYIAMESQILDNDGPAYKNLEPGQYHGSIYKVFAAKKGAHKPTGEWNTQEISVIGRKVKITLNGKVIVDADINSITDPKVLAEHPGLLRERGHIGFLGHGPSEVQFRNIYVRDLSKPEKDNTAPQGFSLLFNGKNLNGWKGLVADPPKRAKMTSEELAKAQAESDSKAFQHWSVVDGVIQYDGKNNNLCTIKDFGDFELIVDWKTGPHADSGIYLRGSPQVQIWDDKPEEAKTLGSGGLYNNQKNPSKPLVRADNPPGQWNRFRILMIGEKVTIYLNNKLVVRNTTLENYWERDKPIYPTGAIELQHHGDALYFKNIYIREIKPK